MPPAGIAPASSRWKRDILLLYYGGQQNTDFHVCFAYTVNLLLCQGLKIISVITDTTSDCILVTFL